MSDSLTHLVRRENRKLLRRLNTNNANGSSPNVNGDVPKLDTIDDTNELGEQLVKSEKRTHSEGEPDNSVEVPTICNGVDKGLFAQFRNRVQLGREREGEREKEDILLIFHLTTQIDYARSPQLD